MAKEKIIQEIEGLGRIVECSVPILPAFTTPHFLDQLIELRKAGVGYSISIRDCAYMRIHNGPRATTKTCHAPICARNSPIILAMVSPLIEDLRMAEQAAKGHRGYLVTDHFVMPDRNGRYRWRSGVNSGGFPADYFIRPDTEIYDKYAEMAEIDKNEEPEKRKAIVLPENKDFIIKRGSEIARTLFQDVEEQYFDKFAHDGIRFCPAGTSFVDAQKGTIIDVLLFSHPNHCSELDVSRLIYGMHGTFGVLKKTSKVGK